MPSNDSERQNKATVCLTVVVVGGGLAGLIAAYALSCAGHDVTIVEQKDSKPQSFGVSQSPPNMTRILNRWGLKPLLDREAEKCASLVMRNGRNGDMIGAMHFDKDFLHDLVADFLFLRTEKLGDLFQQLAEDEGVNSVTATVTDIQTTPSNVTIALDNGQTLLSDFLVCADGYDSPFRRLVSGEEELHDRRTARAYLALTFILPMDLVSQDEELKSIMDPAHWLVWFGSGFIFHTSAPDGGKNLSGTMLSNYNREILPEEEAWTNRPLEYWGIDLDAFEPRAKRLLSLVQVVSSRVLVQRPCIDDLVCENSRIVLVGDAAHPILPGNNQHIGLAVEDAEALRCIFSRIHDRDQIAEFLSAYEDIRLPRITSVVNYDATMNMMLMLPDGPEQDQRNVLLSQSMSHGDWDHMDEAEFKAVWGQELDVYTHDATDQVDDWWTKWGNMMSKKPQHSSSASSTSIPVLHRVSFIQPHSNI
ncbi:FAD-dependent monooxygenase OpS4 [Psilocybe cubensis]|uniref:FAD-binding domain-containing protein n=2 Tax=Psilocybe cubensis TaxID=181762 RepID=A0A8H7XTT4_PSICU|nr:FAD-dependent monooxygenase OpS4 [Psilocybe cubensis]KAH9474456.1 FAD-dependent monooxygenase OpS4 [Psilocybe cubensis]